jgi:hypothetical protein
LSTTNPTWLDPGLNPGRRGGKPVTNRFSYGVACFLPYFRHRFFCGEYLNSRFLLSHLKDTQNGFVSKYGYKNSSKNDIEFA